MITKINQGSIYSPINSLRKWSFLGLCLLALISCGGGGSGGSDNTTNTNSTTNPQGNNQPTNVVVCGSAQSTEDSTLPTAKILFPWKVSRVSDDTITVHGVASDASGIASISVNGIEAKVECNLTKSNNKRKTEDGYAWEATVSIGDNETNGITVTVVDGAGNINEAADQARLLSDFAPTSFVYDPDNNRVIGNLTASEIGITDLATGQTQSLGTFNHGYYGGLALGSNNNVYHIGFDDENLANLSIYSTDILNGEVSTLGTFDSGLPESHWPFENAIAFDSINHILYALVTFFSIDNSNDHQYHIFKYDFNTQQFSTLSSSEQDNGVPLETDHMVFNGDELLVFAKRFADDDSLVSIDLQTGFRTIVSERSNVTGAGIAVDTPSNTAYVTGFSGVGKVNLNDGSSLDISPDAEQDFFNFAQIRSTAVDIANEQVLVGDSDLDMILGVDTNTGERSAVYDNGIGSGHKLILPQKLILDEEAQRALIADSGGNAPEALFSVDLNTGDRTQIGNINQEFNTNINGFALDQQNNRALIAFLDTIIEVDLETEMTSTFSNAMVGTGITLGSITGMVLDPEHNRALVTDFASDAVIAVNLDNGDRTIISQSSTIGEGDAFEGASDIALDTSNGIAYVAAQSKGAVFSVDLETGNRTIVLDECLNDNGENLLDISIDGIFSIAFNSNTNTLWMPSNHIKIYDTDENECSTYPFYLANPYDVDFTSQGQVLAVAFGQLLQIDQTTRQHVTISK